MGFAFDSSDLLELKIRSVQKDSLNILKNFQIKLDDNQFVALKDVVHFNVIKSFEKIIKDAAEKKLLCICQCR